MRTTALFCSAARVLHAIELLATRVEPLVDAELGVTEQMKETFERTDVRTLGVLGRAAA